ncbi:hypothetical protein GCK72_017336 [Caenorhabditis remanei]|uniref:Phosphate transporter n=1 Tax=Caenorhabditis remanei TaxID=31234 RepID=A0A6A5G7X3_CAERE|nr:hypothetical protein GCK72_017336 [Caenorhabditis remanei]KAF1750785.1 hypothetical protein GCK72_017336 [Caenorhabditis remanei]
MLDIVLDVVTSTLAAAINVDDFRHHFLWALIVGICLAFLLGFGMGANDVSNAFGTSVGSGALTLIQAYLLATIFETLGAVLVGYNVIDTMRKGVVDVAVYNNSAGDFLIGQVAALGGTATWLLIATFLHLPVSTTHAVVGATLGYSIACKGFQGIQWMMVVNIVASWFISPIFSGCVSLSLYLFVDHVILRTSNPVANGLMWLPIFYFVCLTFNMFMISYQGSKVLHLSTVPLWIAILISLAAGIIAAGVCHFLIVPSIRKYIAKGKQADTRQSNASSVVISVTEDPEIDKVAIRSGSTTTCSSDSDSVQSPPTPPGKAKKFITWLLPNKERTESQDTLRMFTSVQTLTACFAGFAHGANDVCNAIAPLVALIAVYRDFDVYQKKETPLYVLLYGVLAICVGLWCLGHKVIRTVGTKMSDVNPASGFCIEFGAAVTALLASKLGLPISTTHCLVGAVVAVGSVKGGKSIDWGLFRNVAFSWVVTLPVAGGFAALYMWLLHFTIPAQYA